MRKSESGSGRTQPDPEFRPRYPWAKTEDATLGAQENPDISAEDDERNLSPLDRDLSAVLRSHETDLIAPFGANVQLPNGTKVTAAFRAKEALKLRLQGKNFAQIAEQLGFNTPRTAHNAYTAALKWAAMDEDLDALVQAEVLRLDSWAEKLVSRGLDARAVEVLVKVSERRARLLGLDAPEKHLVKGQFNVDARVMEVKPDFVADVIRELNRSNIRALEPHSQESMDSSQADSEASGLSSGASA